MIVVPSLPYSFEDLRSFSKILFTGPHRSGTTFAATAAYHDLKDTHGLVREELCWQAHRGLSSADYWLKEFNGDIIVQAPFLADVCHQFPGVLIVFMHRDIDDIEASQKRMPLEGGGESFWPTIEMSERSKYLSTDYNQRVSEVKYESWQFQKKQIANYLELEYESLVDHPLFVPKEQRKKFHVRQTSVG